MKLATIPLCLALTFGVATQAYSMNLHGEKETYSKVYKPTEKAVIKTLDKMGIDTKVDEDGDLVYTVPGRDWSAYVIFSHTGSAEKLWNLQMRVQFATKSSRYDEVIEFANKWNATKKVPKMAMKDQDSLVISMNYPVQYGFNPDEFEENVFDMFNRTVKQIAEETDAMRR